jgi:hypothetical protein
MSHQFIIDRNKFALNDQLNTTRSEFLNDKRISGSNNDQIREIINQLNYLECGRKSLIWLGNSQQHTINHYNEGQHLAVYWLAKKLSEIYVKGCVNGISYPSISMIEMSYIIKNLEISNKEKLKKIIIPLEFMGFRQTGVRQDIISLFGDINQYDQPKFPLTKTAIQYDSSFLTPQWLLSFDRSVDRFLKDKLIFWADRLDIQSTFEIYLIILRNKLLNIKSTSVRPLLEGRMYENLNALDEILEFSRKNKIILIFYFVPIRPEGLGPYAANDYALWQKNIEDVIAKHGYFSHNFRELVPLDEWGSNFKNDIDYMHFTEHGHKRLASVLFDIIAKN